MQKHVFDKDYTQYTFADFLQDDFFLSSIVNPTDASIRFWNDRLRKKELNAEEFNLAKEFLDKSIRTCHDSVTDEDISSLWKSIQASNRKVSKQLVMQTRFRKMLYMGASVAASIIVLFFVLPTLKETSENDGKDLMSYVESHKKSVEESSDVQLVLSHQHVLSIKEEAARVTYDADNNIKVSEKEIVQQETSDFNQLVVPKGKRSRLTLSDGTTMHVNSGTRVIYPNKFVGDTREIYVDGEIYIEVTPNKKIPFIIKTSDINVQVLGTKFNVMAYESDANKQVVLVSGSVKVSSKDTDKNTVLVPSDMYSYSDKKESVTKVDTEKYTAWTDGVYYCESESLDLVMLRLSRYYGVDIDCDENIAKQICTGKIDMKDSLSDVLKGLSFSFPIKVDYGNGKYNITELSNVELKTN